MIVRMAKVEIIGPKESLLPVLDLLRQRGALHVEKETAESVEERAGAYLSSYLLNREALEQRLFLEDFKKKVDALLACLPETAVRESYLDPENALDAVASLVDRHLAECRELGEQKADMEQEMRQLDHAAVFLRAMGPMLKEVPEDGELALIGVEVSDPRILEELARLLHGWTEGHFEIHTARLPERGLAGLVVTEKERAERVRRGLSQEHLPEYSLPAFAENRPFADKLQAVEERRVELERKQAECSRQLADLARGWLGIYRMMARWIGDQLSLLGQSAALYETRMCFILFGWLPAEAMERLEALLAERFAGKVVLEEKAILEQDLDCVPVALKNTGYFKPFEIFTRLLPLPRYYSIDPTPFIGIFFPLFFGMILGDMGYGAILLVVALGLAFLVRQHPLVRDAGKILAVSAVYTIFFGWLFGECFGEFGSEVLGLEPICFDRRTAVMPMLYFALSVGVFHVLLGLVLGFVTALKRGLRKEALLKLLSILVILCACVFAASYFVPLPPLFQKPLLISLLIIVALLVLVGGILGPLELIKNFGNIISYARIMAVGLTSVLLAHVANTLAGLTGNIVAGALVAIALHAFNIVLGVFAPTIHALRLHYVEFFSKFVEPGGRRFEPLDKK